ncbi:MAG: hypothetical protein ACT4N2_01090 [Hyphomicrobium sp.]
MSDLPRLSPGQSWWAGLADVHKINPSEHMDDDADGAYCWVAVAATSEEEATELIMSTAKDEGLTVEGIEDMQPVTSLDEMRELDEGLAENAASMTAGDIAIWGTLNLYESEAA